MVKSNDKKYSISLFLKIFRQKKLLRKYIFVKKHSLIIKKG